MRSHVSLRQLSGRALLMVLCAQAAAPTLAAEPVNRRPAATTGKSATPAASREQFVDGIAAIVDKDVITLRELDVAMRNATQDLQAQKIQVPPQEVLQRQVLEQIIMQRVQKHEAERMNIRVEDAQIDQAIQTIAQRNRLTSAQMQAEVQKSGVSWADYRRQLGDEIRLDRMRQRAVDSSIVISDAEVDAYLKEQARRGGAPAGFGQPGARTQAPTAPAAAAAQTQPTVLALGQILLRVPEGADSSSVASLRKKAEDILAQLRSGTDFASAAAANSDGPEALEGGNMGARPVEGWPELFLKAVADLQPGQPSDIVQSGNGFHILMVLGRQGGGSAPAPAQAPAPAAPAQAAAPQGPMNVTQTRARHILIKTSTVMS
ncbi:MAG: peptidylprolyl isomerase, partial [Burkholderiaceae bacterium]|nr:peptidylprolyl isomerase [Burkholderiaceae bacterium]